MPNYERRKMVVANEANCAKYVFFQNSEFLLKFKFFSSQNSNFISSKNSNFFLNQNFFSSVSKIPQATPGILFSIDIFESFPTGR